jgi:hypothetical protein
MQGWRISMEDAHATVLDLQAKYTGTDDKPTDPEHRLAFFGVYDGHGGDKVALFTGENLHKIVSRQDAFAKGDIEQALKDGFLATDRAILEGLCCVVSEVPHAGSLTWAQTPVMRRRCLAVLLPRPLSHRRRSGWYVMFLGKKSNIGLKKFRLTGHRLTLVIHDPSWVSRDAQSPSHSTTSLKMRVSAWNHTRRYMEHDGDLTKNYYRREGPYHGCWWLRRFRPCQWQPCPVPCYR